MHTEYTPSTHQFKNIFSLKFNFHLNVHKNTEIGLPIKVSITNRKNDNGQIFENSFGKTKRPNKINRKTLVINDIVSTKEFIPFFKGNFLFPSVKPQKKADKAPLA